MTWKGWTRTRKWKESLPEVLVSSFSFVVLVPADWRAEFVSSSANSAYRSRREHGAVADEGEG